MQRFKSRTGNYEKDFKSGLLLPRHNKSNNITGAMFFSGPLTDPDFANVILLAHCDGTDEGTTFTDSSSLAQTLSPGNVVTDASNAKYGTAGARFDTNAGLGSISCSNTNAFKPLHDGSNWTWESWERYSGYGAAQQGIFGNTDTTGAIGVFCYLDSSRRINLSVVYGSPGNFIVNGVSGTIWPNDTSYHFLRITCDFSLGSNNYKVYIDDMNTPAAQFSKTGNTPSSSNPSAGFYIGAYGSGGAPKSNGGAFDDVRITKNVVRTGAAPTAAFPDSA